jgi:phosphonate transport system substrate-binding protein
MQNRPLGSGRKCGSTLLLAVGVFLLVSFAPTANAQTAAPMSALENEKTLVLARVSESAGKHLPKRKKMATYLGDRLKDVGIEHIRVVVALDLEQLTEMVGDGSVDLVSETAFIAMRLKEDAGAEPLLQEWKKGVAEYKTVFFVRKDSGITSFKALVGKKIPFEDAGSTSAFLLPAAILQQKGFRVQHLKSPRSRVPAGTIGYFFASGEVNQVLMVGRGIAQAGAFSNLDWDALERTPTSIRKDLSLLHISEPVLRSMMIGGKHLAPRLKAKIKKILLAMHEDDAGKKVLKKYYKVKKYSEISASGQASLARVGTLLKYVRDKVR